MEKLKRAHFSFEIIWPLSSYILSLSIPIPWFCIDPQQVSAVKTFRSRHYASIVREPKHQNAKRWRDNVSWQIVMIFCRRLKEMHLYIFFFSRVPLIKALDLEWNWEKVLNIIRLVLGQKTFNGQVNGARLVCKTVFEVVFF